MGPATFGDPCGGTGSSLSSCVPVGRPIVPREQLRQAWGVGWESALESGIVGHVTIEPFMPQG